MRLHGWTILLLVVADILEAGCQKKRASFTPPPAPTPQQSAVPAKAPEQLPQPPDIQPESVRPAVPVPGQASEIPPPPAPQVQQAQPRPRRSPTDSRAQPSVSEAPAPNPAPAEPLRLGPMTTPEQERDLNAQIDQALGSAEASLRTIAGRSLTKDQEAAVAQVQSFVRQTAEIRKTDLPAAKSLAQRADILARDLLASLR